MSYYTNSSGYGNEKAISGCVQIANCILDNSNSNSFNINSNDVKYIYNPINNYFTETKPKPKLNFVDALEKELKDWCGGILNSE